MVVKPKYLPTSSYERNSTMRVESAEEQKSIIVAHITCQYEWNIPDHASEPLRRIRDRLIPSTGLLSEET
jgi:hypothetical protein